MTRRDRRERAVPEVQEDPDRRVLAEPVVRDPRAETVRRRRSGSGSPVTELRRVVTPRIAMAPLRRSASGSRVRVHRNVTPLLHPSASGSPARVLLPVATERPFAPVAPFVPVVPLDRVGLLVPEALFAQVARRRVPIDDHREHPMMSRGRDMMIRRSPMRSRRSNWTKLPVVNCARSAKRTRTG